MACMPVTTNPPRPTLLLLLLLKAVHDFEGHGGRQVQVIETAGTPTKTAFDNFDLSCCMTW